MSEALGHVPESFERLTYAKAGRRLIPFLFVLYVVAFLDRVNISYAQLQMSSDLNFNDAIYGFGAGLFFIGYFLFEVPSNLLLERVGARLWIARILVVWGVVATAFVFVRTPAQFYILRFVLGASEAGFFPGVILFLTYWFPTTFRARTVSTFMTGIAVAGVFGAPLSGWIMRNMAGVSELAGWQWVFLVEGLPAIVLGVITLVWLQDGPQDAYWLSDEERRLVVRRVDEDRRHRAQAGGHQHLLCSLQDVTLWAFAAIAFCINVGMYGLNFFLPRLLQERGVTDPLWNGVLVAVCFAVGAVAMVINGRHSDANMERAWHTAAPAIAAGVGLAISAGTEAGGLAVAMIGLTLAVAGTLACLSTFWSCPPTFFAAPTAAAGIALLNSIGSLGGFVGPSVMGLARTHLHSNVASLYVLVGAFFLCAALALVTLKPRQSLSPTLEQVDAIPQPR
jgi:MFS family permease